MDSLKLTLRTLQYGAGIYEAGEPEKCYVKLFVTDTGRVLPVNHRVITEDDLLTVYGWGRLDEQEFPLPHTDDPRLPDEDEVKDSDFA